MKKTLLNSALANMTGALAMVFIIRDRADVAKASFNQEQDWQLRRIAAPLGDGMTRRRLTDYGVLAQFPVQIRRTVPES